jgi:hypothetical protein
MARLGRRQAFKPLLRTLIQFAPPSAGPPVGTSKMVSAVQRDRRFSQRSFQPVLRGLIQYQPPAAQPPIGKNRLVSFASIQSAEINYHRHRHPWRAFPITVLRSATTPFLPLIRRDPKAPAVLRGFTERVTNILNALMRAGELVQDGADGWHIEGTVSSGSGPPAPGSGVPGSIYFDVSDPSNIQFYFRT